MQNNPFNVVTKAGYTIKALVEDLGDYHAIIYRENKQDYVFCTYYDITTGVWGFGHYCSTYAEALQELSDYML